MIDGNGKWPRWLTKFLFFLLVGIQVSGVRSSWQLVNFGTYLTFSPPGKQGQGEAHKRK